MSFHKLRFTQGERIEARSGNWVRTGRTYLDFLISGDSLKNILEISDSELIGTLGWSGSMEVETKKVNELIGLEKSELESGRTCLYVCPECGHIGCGSVTVKIVYDQNIIIWKEFGWETDRGKPNLKEFKHISPLKFKRLEYMAVFEKLMKENKRYYRFNKGN